VRILSPLIRFGILWCMVIHVDQRGCGNKHEASVPMESNKGEDRYPFGSYAYICEAWFDIKFEFLIRVGFIF
jgi:hypothetical protein